MILSKWVLTPNDYFSLCGDNRYKMHQAVCDIFDEASVKFDITAHKGNYVIITQSTKNVTKNPLTGSIVSKEIPIKNFISGVYRLTVNLNAVIQVKREGKKNYSKVAVTADKVNEWIQSRENRWGIECNNIRVNPTQTQISVKNGNKITCKSHLVIIDCNVIDPELFQSMITSGIGSQRSFGYGLVKSIKISN